MATVIELSATARPKSGKGAARAVRRAGRVPGVIYGDNKEPIGVSLDFKELKQKIYAGHFLTTVCNLDVDGTKHRVIPRDFQLDPVMDNPIHVDFLRLGEGAQVRVRVPIHVKNADQAPGIKRGGTVNIVTHTIAVQVSADDIPQAFDVDLTGLEINYSRHLSDIQLPANVQGARARRHHAGHHRAAVRLRRRNEGGGRSGCGGCSSGPGRGGRSARADRRAGSNACSGSGGGSGAREEVRRFCLSTPGRAWRGRDRLFSAVPDPCCCSSGSAIRAPSTRATATTSDSWWLQAIAKRHGFPPWRRRFQGVATEGTIGGEKVLLLLPGTYMNESGRAVAEAQHFYKMGLGDIVVFHDEIELPPAKVRVKAGGGIAGHNGLRSISAHVGNDYRRVRIGVGHPGVKELVHAHVLSDFAKSERAMGRGAVRRHRRQCRPAGAGQGFELPEQGASRHDGEGFWRSERAPRKNRWASNAASSACRMSANRRCSMR